MALDNIQSIRRARDPFSYGRARTLVAALWAMCILGVVAACGILGLGIYLVASEYGEMLHGATKFGIFAGGISVAALALVGVIGLKKRSRPTIFAYSILLGILMAFQIALFIFYFGWRDEATELVDDVWASSTAEARDEIQADLQCCGFRSLDDYPGPNCQANWDTPCAAAIYELLWAQRVYILVVLILTLIVEVASLAISAYLVHILPNERDRATLDLEEEWLKSLGVNADDDDDDDANELHGIY